jgi:hypothetical protein
MNNFNLEKEVYAILAKYDPMRKMEKIRINISSSFMARARCIECGGHPDYYYQIRKPYMWKDISHQISTSKWMRGWLKRFTADWYLESEPKYFLDVKEFGFVLDDKHYVPTLFKNRGEPKTDRDNVVEIVGCGCGATVWAFNDKSTKNRPEITNRKGRYKYPQAI